MQAIAWLVKTLQRHKPATESGKSAPTPGVSDIPPVQGKDLRSRATTLGGFLLISGLAWAAWTVPTAPAQPAAIAPSPARPPTIPPEWMLPPRETPSTPSGHGEGDAGASPSAPPASSYAPYAPPPSSPAVAASPATAAPAVVSWQDRKRLGGIGVGSPATPMAYTATLSASPAAEAREADDIRGPGNPVRLQTQLDSPRTDVVRASRLPSRQFLLAKGTLVRCLLDTAIDSTLPGMVLCHGLEDVYSDDGRTVLLPRGTRYVGEYQADMRQGEQRLFVLWTRAQTPHGVVVDLASPAVDALGRAGIEGQVDDRFGRRFGTAIALSVLNDLAATASARRDSGNTIVLGNSARAGEQVVGKVLEDAGAIRPVLRKAPGELVQIMLARDLDFSSVTVLEAGDGP